MDNKSKLIVIIDDDEDLVKLLTTAFQSKGYSTQAFLKGQEGLNYLNVPTNIEKTSLIILDRMLPDMDGLDILHQLKNNPAFKIPVLILSVLSSEKDIVSGLKTGAIDYVPKPFSLPILLQKAFTMMAG